MGLSDFFKSKKHTVTQEPLQTDTQKQMQKLLAQFAQSGKLGGQDLTGAFTGKVGEFSPTGIEQAGQGRLSSLLAGGVPQGVGQAQGVISQLLSGEKFNPLAEGSLFDPFKTQVTKEIGQASDRLKHRQAITGDLFSTSTGKEQRKLEETGLQLLTGKLAELYDQFAGRQLAGTETAAKLAQVEQGLGLDQIQASQTMGALNRLLKDAEAKAKLDQFYRDRENKLLQIDTAKTLFSQNVPFGVREFTTKSASPFMNLLTPFLEKTGSAIGDGLVGAFNPSKALGVTGKSAGIGAGINPFA